MEVLPDQRNNVNLQGHFLYKDKSILLEIWLEEDGFFRLRFEETQADGYAVNEERGSYKGDKQEQFELAPMERQWKWKDQEDGDSGVDHTDLTYPVSLGEEGLKITYQEIPYVCKKM
eukprot:TRINITY_DN5236_c0_g2_i1.p1 TRINITY_DN5236_c0_g2~~TRINITY_DN5236_c0_g2_i1.p1  ORF type:complete len:117 (-),score=23.87 TRINITY_DN5236_c0_g2_i1:35-385(-)